MNCKIILKRIGMYKPFEKEHIIIAHRGYSKFYPENTLLAFKKSINKFDMIELDVQFTKDKIPIVFHDEKIENIYIKELNYNQIKNRFIKKGSFSDKIPTLYEVVDLIKKRKIYSNIEIKPSFLETDEVLGIIEENIKKIKDYVIISSFNHNYLKIDSYKAALFDLTAPKNINSYIKKLSLDAVHISVQLSRFINPKKIIKPVNVYTINNKNQIKKLFKKGFKGVFSDGL